MTSISTIITKTLSILLICLTTEYSVCINYHYSVYRVLILRKLCLAQGKLVPKCSTAKAAMRGSDMAG